MCSARRIVKNSNRYRQIAGFPICTDHVTAIEFGIVDFHRALRLMTCSRGIGPIAIAATFSFQ